jgi:hypothetical protein
MIAAAASDPGRSPNNTFVASMGALGLAASAPAILNDFTIFLHLCSAGFPVVASWIVGSWVRFYSENQ